MNDTIRKILRISHVEFADTRATPESIKAFIKRMRSAYPEGKIDEKELFAELEAIHSVTIEGDIKVLENNTGHEDWFNPQTGVPLKRNFKWHFWDHFHEYLSVKKSWPANVTESLDRFSNVVLSKIEDPLRPGTWDRRGMVVGNVQSGKTANYSALITKATDAGYKLVIVLAGVHNSLRSQTQERLSEEFLGYEIDEIKQDIVKGNRTGVGATKIGVGEMFKRSGHNVVNTLTTRANDFVAGVARNAGITPSTTGDPVIMVVKKNVTILKNLVDWLSGLNPGGAADDVPLLLIDDECDYASVNTRTPERDENGNILSEWDPAKTNKYIRKLLCCFKRKIYIGYTATPYANIFINKTDTHPNYGKDLFPEHFLINLPQPTNYIGPEELFGLKEDIHSGIEETEPLPLTRAVSDSESAIPGRHKRDYEIKSLPDSLKTALKSFILVCAARRVRGTGTPHNSMLIHVTRFTPVQSRVAELITKELKKSISRIMSGTDALDDFKTLWEKDFLHCTKDMATRKFREAEAHPWASIKKELFPAASKIQIKTINGEIGDTLAYREKEKEIKRLTARGEKVSWEESGVSVIAVGGDKLSRGLTLDGLSVSYYLRASRMYDTLMQMGRWFGYRDGYNDLCRIYTTAELIEWYRHIALANKELKNLFDYMEASGSSPEKFGLKVRSHPGRLAITSAGKSRSTERMKITFAGCRVQTIVFDPRVSAANMTAVNELITSIGRKCDVDYEEKKPRYQWKGVRAEDVVRFLRKYTTQETEMRIVDPKRIADYIEKQIPLNELIEWDVVLVSNDKESAMHEFEIQGRTLRSVRRKPLGPIDTDRISLGTLTSPKDEFLDIPEERIKECEAEFKSLKANPENAKLRLVSHIRKLRPPERGLLLIYFPAYRADSQSDIGKEYGLKSHEMPGFAISFPNSDNAEPIEYIVNPVYMEEEA